MPWPSGATGAEIARRRPIKIRLFACALAAAVVHPVRASERYETVVTAPPAAAAREDDAASASVITADRTPRSAETLPAVLAELPGVAVTRLGGLGALATLSVRGSSPDQVQVYLDGVPLNSATFGGVDLGRLPLADLERVEVYRGMTPIAFGASGLGGVVSLITRVPRQSALAAEAGGGSFGTTFASAQADWAGQRVRLLAAVHRLDSTGDFLYPSDNGTAFEAGDDRLLRRQNNQLHQTDALVRAAVPLPGSRLLLAGLSYFQRAAGLPGYAIFQSQQATLATRRFLASASYDGPDDLGPGGRLRVVVHGATGGQELRDLRPDLALVPTHTHDRSQSLGATVIAGRRLADWFLARAVLDVRGERFVPFDERAASPSGPPGVRRAAAAGAEAELGWRRWRIIPSARLESAYDSVVRAGLLGARGDQARASAWIEPVVRLAVLQRPAPGVALRANLGRYARLPTMFERYGNGGVVQGNPDLAPEAGLNADLGATLSTGALCADAALFGARVHDLIQLEQGRLVARARNIDEARVLGAELSLQARLGGHARLIGQATYTDARNVGGVSAYRDRQLPLRPRLRAHARPELERLPLPGRWRLGLYAEGDLTGGNFLDPANLARVPPRLLLGAGLNLTSPAGRWRLIASAENLGDSRINDLAGYPLPGRSLFVTLQWTTASQDKEPAP
jgi:vitamin B12 transporter